MSKNLPTTFALAAAALFLSACETKGATASPDDGGKASAAKIKCFGVNECAGQGACDIPDGRVEPGSKGHSCAGQNSCAGKGWVSLPADECSAKGGEPV